MSDERATASRRKTLREQLEEGWVLSAGCYDAWSAKLAEHVGFTSLHFSGGAYHTSQFAYAGLTYTMPELVGQVGRITQAVETPMLVDIDTGFGGVEDILRATREVERAGGGGIHIEDLPFPIVRDPGKPQTVIPIEEAVGRVRAALAARTDPEFLVVGRTDSTKSVDDLIERCNRYLEAGADVAFPILRGVHVGGVPLSQLALPEKLAHYRRITDEIEGPVLTVGGIDREVGADQLRDCGFSWAVLPLISFHAATAAMIHALREASADGLAAHYFAEHPSPLPTQEYLTLVGADRVARHQRDFGGIE